MTPQITPHDLNNKVKQVKEFAEKHNIIKVWMKLKSADAETTEKGRVILKNVRERIYNILVWK
jgi:translation initiation factor IF-3